MRQAVRLCRESDYGVNRLHKEDWMNAERVGLGRSDHSNSEVQAIYFQKLITNTGGHVSMPRIVLNLRQYRELENIALGVFAPLDGFMSEEEFINVVGTMRLLGGAPFPLPVVLDLSIEQVAKVRDATEIVLEYDAVEVGTLTPNGMFGCDKLAISEHVFGTSDASHPGVAHLLRMGDTFVGGRVALSRRVLPKFAECALTPADTRAVFAAKGWKTICGFQTRNIPHRAHEQLQRMALEECDGLFIQPLIGAKKKGDYIPEVILTAYRTLIDGFLPRDRVVLGVLSTAMRYAGPREALFHALIRRNYGCTHFVVGRDHAGVGDYYGKYEAHEVTRRFEAELGIKILRYHGPFHCRICDGIVTEKSCPHGKSAPESITEISGTLIRSILRGSGSVRSELLREEVVASIRGTKLFIEEDAE